MDVNEDDSLSNITLRYKLKLRNSVVIAVLHFNHRKVAQLYTIMIVNHPLQLSGTLNMCGETLNLGILTYRCHLVNRILFPRCQVINKKY